MALQQYNQFDPKIAGLEGNMQAEPRVFAHDAGAVVIGAINSTDANKGLDITAAGTGFVVNEVITYAAGSVAGTGLSLTVTETDALDVNLQSSLKGGTNGLLGSTTIAFSGATNTSYTGLEPGVSTGVTTSGAGTGLQMSLTVAGGVATALTVTTVGTGYADGDTILFGTGTFGGAITMVITLGTGSVTNFDVTTVGSIYVVGESLTFTTSAAGIGFTADVSNIDIPSTQRRGCCIYSGASQTVQVELESGNTVSFVGVNAGSFLPILAKRLLVGTNILALY